MHPAELARQAPERRAVVVGDDAVSFAEVEDRSRRLALWMRSRGLRRGDTVAILLPNHLRFLEVAWAAQRSGLYYTTVNWHLTPEEAGYIVADCGARLLVTSHSLVEMAERAAAYVEGDLARLLVDGRARGWDAYEQVLAATPGTDLKDECEGDFMLYSSGTTGRPKGIRRALTFPPMGQGLLGAVPFLRLLGMQPGDVYLCPAPLYHAAPLAWSLAAQRMASTVVVMERFDAREALALIERHRISHAQFVPTMFVRMLKLEREERESFDLSSLRAVVHAVAPCPVDVKHQMIQWWGPIISEYYSSTEGVGTTFITSEEWLAHPGSVGRAMMGTPHIVDEQGRELGPGQIGTVYFDGGSRFEYHNDPDKTASTYDGRGWGSVGDMGYLDDKGYLYLTDRRTFMIISGGVNIYPQEIENLLVNHPKVMDAAVIGVPNAEFGEEVKAVVQPVDWDDAGPELEAELMAWCRGRLAGFKCPRSVDFDPELPRQDNGKLYKRLLSDRYRSPVSQ